MDTSSFFLNYSLKLCDRTVKIGQVVSVFLRSNAAYGPKIPDKVRNVIKTGFGRYIIKAVARMVQPINGFVDTHDSGKMFQVKS